MFNEIILLVWSLAALAWWIVAWRLAEPFLPEVPASRDQDDGRWITIFKPLPRLGEAGRLDQVALESFLMELDATSELLLGVHEEDRLIIHSWIARMQQRYPDARWRVVFRSEPDDVANPKIAWLRILARDAQGDLWLWSDADIVAPRGFLAQARRDYARADTAMLTFPYVVTEISGRPGLLDALFVNAEFYPGALLLRRCGTVDFGFGAAMLFSRKEFERLVDWDELSSALADDFVLGQKLKPVRIGSVILSTRVEAFGWRGAILHYLRWSKTIWWNRPLGTAVRIIVLPALGWMIRIAVFPTQPLSWFGLLLVLQMDFFFAILICRRVGCAVGWRDFPIIQGWALGRILAWMACVLPWPVMWRGRCWWRPKLNPIKELTREHVDKA